MATKETLATVIDVLVNTTVDKKQIFARLVEYYPEVFLSLFYCTFQEFVTKEEAENVITALEAENVRVYEANKRLQEQVVALRAPDYVEPYQKRVDATVMKEVMSLLYQGQKINAIKIYREASNLGLKDSKEVVDYLQTLVTA